MTILISCIVLAVAGTGVVFWHLATARLDTKYNVKPSAFLERFLAEYKAQHPLPKTINGFVDADDLYVRSFCGSFENREYLTRIVIRYDQSKVKIAMSFEAHIEKKKLNFFHFHREFTMDLNILLAEQKCWSVFEEFKQELVNKVPKPSRIRWIAAWTFMDVDDALREKQPEPEESEVAQFNWGRLVSQMGTRH